MYRDAVHGEGPLLEVLSSPPGCYRKHTPPSPYFTHLLILAPDDDFLNQLRG